MTVFKNLKSYFLNGLIYNLAIRLKHLNIDYIRRLEECKLRIEKALTDDFDTPKAITAMEELVKTANAGLGSKSEVFIYFL